MPTFTAPPFVDYADLNELGADDGYITLQSADTPIIQSEDDFSKLMNLIPEIQKVFSTATATRIHPFRRQVEALREDVEYIKDNLQFLTGLQNSDWSEASDLTYQLMDATMYDAADFAPDSLNLKRLLQVIVKLKLCFPILCGSRGRHEDGSLFIKKIDAVDYGKEFFTPEIPQQWTAGLHSSYESLTAHQKLCVLCFSISQTKEVIYWWVGEGFIDPDLNLDEGENQEAQARQLCGKKMSVEEIGEQMIKVLTDKGFIKPQVKKGRVSGNCIMHPFVYAFVCEQANRAGFLDFSNETGKLIPFFKRSKRACLLNLEKNSPSSCQIWATYAHNHKRLKMFKTVQTLFNVNESIIDIKPVWFSKMECLSVLHLGSWGSGAEEHIEVEDEEFLDNMKSMQKLKLFSLRRVSRITKLPDSFCKLSNLTMLDLKECHNLEELPADIGCLKNITHLDVANCHLLNKLPKGVRSLSKLEVLKGFVINGPQARKKECFLKSWCRKNNEEACNLGDLLRLKKLRELSIVTNNSKFPRIEELEVFKEMENLCKLKISWERCFTDDETKAVCSGDIIDGDEKPVRGFLDQIKALKLWCVPDEAAPSWMVPGHLKNLRDLCVTGGKIRGLRGGTLENEWKVETLRLKCLPDLVITWTDLKVMFPHMVYFENFECDQLGLFPDDLGGVWKKENEAL